MSDPFGHEAGDPVSAGLVNHSNNGNWQWLISSFYHRESFSKYEQGLTALQEPVRIVMGIPLIQFINFTST